MVGASARSHLVSDFDDTNDYVASISFASNATVDFPIGHHFQTPITNSMNTWNKSSFSGGTFGPGGLVLAKSQNDSVVTTANIVGGLFHGRFSEYHPADSVLQWNAHPLQFWGI